jgi:uncharacterized protein
MTNKEIVQQCYADFGSGNIEGLLNALKDDIVWIDPGHVGNVYKGKRLGKEQVLDFFKNLSQEITITQFEVRSLSETGNKVFAEGFVAAHGNVSKVKADSDWAMVWELENGKVKYHHLYLDTNALAGAITN